MKIACFWEHNEEDTLLFAVDFPGVFTRGESLGAAIAKMPAELSAYLDWLGENALDVCEVVIVQEKQSDLNIRDADSDAIFENENFPLSQKEYEDLKAIALRSAKDFESLYRSVPDKESALSPLRKTFYGNAPYTAREMYEHTKSVNEYYFAEIGVTADNSGSIFECRERGFEVLETQTDFLKRTAVQGSYGEYWSIRKMLRRFIWHDRIHAKAMWRGANREFGAKQIANPFCFTQS